MPFIGSVGPVELIIVLVIALLVIGPRRLPEMGSAVGKTIREFRKASTDISEAATLEPEAKSAQPATAPAAPPPAPVPATAPVAPQPAASSTESAAPGPTEPVTAETTAEPRPTTPRHDRAGTLAATQLTRTHE